MPMHWLDFVKRWVSARLADATPSTTTPAEEPGEAEEIYATDSSVHIEPGWVLTVYWTDDTLTQQKFTSREALHQAVDYYATVGKDREEPGVQMSGFAILDVFNLVIGEDARAKLHVFSGTNTIN